MSRTILVTGGAGYIGSILVPKLLKTHRVVTLDALWFERTSRLALAPLRDHNRFTFVQGDIRDQALVESVFRDHAPDAVIHLAAVSNDPCSDIDPDLTREVNLIATASLMRSAKAAGVRLFVNASSASVYGIKETPEVTEDLALEPLTLYARYKAETEAVLNSLADSEFRVVSVRAATVCGYSPRLRLDLTVNILTSQAIAQRQIRVFGGSQMRPNVHIEDLTDFYAGLLDIDPSLLNGKAFNVSAQNHTVGAIAEIVRGEIDPAIEIRVEPTSDLRSYHLSAERVRRELGWGAKRGIAEAVRDLARAFSSGAVPDSDDPIYRNVETMRSSPAIYRIANSV